jgi:glutamyl/glutaminyl-tRNA synthetase
MHVTEDANTFAFLQWAHLGLLLNEDRSKLSKRQGDVAVEDFQVRLSLH